MAGNIANFKGKKAAPFKAGAKKRAPNTAAAGGAKVAQQTGGVGMVMPGHPKGHGNMSFGARMAALRGKKKAGK